MVPQFVPGAGNLEWRAVIGRRRFGGEIEVSKGVKKPTSLPLAESEHKMSFDRIETRTFEPAQHLAGLAVPPDLE